MSLAKAQTGLAVVVALVSQIEPRGPSLTQARLKHQNNAVEASRPKKDQDQCKLKSLNLNYGEAIKISC